MATGETFRIRLARARVEALRSGRVVLGMGFVERGARAVSYFLLAAVLSGGRIFEGAAPFALALVGGAGSGADAAAALAGASFGYLTLLGMVDGLRYVSAAILVFALAFAFYDVKLYRRPWTMPVATAMMNGCTGFLYLSQKGWRPQDVIWFALEITLTGLATYGFRAALEHDGTARQEEHRLGGVLLLAAVLITLSGVKLFGTVSLGGILAAAVVLLCAWQGGGGIGAAMGVGLGLAMDLAGGSGLYVMALGGAGLAAGLVRGGRRIGASTWFLVANSAVGFWLWSNGAEPALLAEGVGGCLLFLLLPMSVLRRLGVHLAGRELAGFDRRAAEYVQMRLEHTSQAFRTLYESLRNCFQRPGDNNEDPAVIFDRAADRVCRTCELRGTCWERDYVTTVNAFNDATENMLDRGRGEAGDFPAHFSSRCVRFTVFLGAVNEELSALLYRRQYSSRIQDSRQAVCRQYRQLSDILAEAAAELGQELTPDLPRERRVRQHLAVLGLEGDAAVFYDREGRMHLRIDAPAGGELGQEEQIKVLSDLLGVPMRREEGGNPRQLMLTQCEPFMAVAGIAARKRDGETVSGDAGTWFKRSDGKLYVLLCDGMGSGIQANRESGLAVRLLEQFLKAGVETENALLILNCALSLRAEEEGGFTTVDLLQVDLFTGQAVIYKFGAAPTYIKGREGVRRIEGDTLPAGVTVRGRVRPDCTRVKLEPGDCVLMVSDGVCGSGTDDWLRSRLAGFDGASPKELARDLLSNGPEEGATDDRTALVIRLARRLEQV